MPIQRVPFAQPVESRDGSAGLSAKDSFTYNLFFDTVGHDRFVQKRPGYVAAYTFNTGYANPIKAYLQIRPNVGIIACTASGVSTAGLWSVDASGNRYLFYIYTPTNPSFNWIDSSTIALVDYDRALIIDISAPLTPVVKTIVQTGKVVSATITARGSNYLNPGLTVVGAGTPAATFKLDTSGYTTRNTGVTGPNQLYSATLLSQGNTSGSATATLAEVAVTATVTSITTSSKFTLSWDTTTASDVCPVGASITGAGVPASTTITATGVSGTSDVTASAACTLSVGQTVTLTGAGTGGNVTINTAYYPQGVGATSCVFNGRLVVFQGLTQKLWASDVGAFTNFNPLNFVSAESYPDFIVGITRHLNYVVAFGGQSLQYFYDNGSSTGNNLSPALSYNQEVGLVSGQTIAKFQNGSGFLGRAKDGSIGAYILSGSGAEKISTPAIDRILYSWTQKGQLTSNLYGYATWSAGHTFLVFVDSTTSLSIVFDMTEKSWHVWNSPALFGGGVAEASVFSYDTPLLAPKQGLYVISFGTQYTYDNYGPGDLGVVTANVGIATRSQTDILDGGVTKRKFFRRAEAIGNKTTGTLTVEYSDDDYNTWAGGRTVDLAASRSQMYGLGQSRRRAFRFTHQANQPFRLLSMELQYDIGELENDGVIEPVYRR